MFSERYRLIKVILISAALLLLCLYSYQTALSGRLHRQQATKDQLYEGRIPVKFGFAKVTEVFDDGHIVLASGNNKYEIETNTKFIKTGHYVSLSGYHQSDGKLIVKKMVIHHYRWIKKGVSVVITFFILYLVVTHFRISWKERVLLERP